MVKIVDTRNCLATVDGIDQAQVPRRYNGILGQQLDRSLLPDTSDATTLSRIGFVVPIKEIRSLTVFFRTGATLTGTAGRAFFCSWA